MLLPVYLTLAIAAFFYAIAPLIAILHRERAWASFRAAARGLPGIAEVTYRDVIACDAAAYGTGKPGAGSSEKSAVKRLSGRIEGLEGQTRLWIQGANVSAVVDFSRASLYTLLPDARGLPLSSTARAGSIRKTAWKRVRSLSEGTKLLVAGPTSVQGGRLVFSSLPGRPLFAVSYEGDEDGLLDELIAGARPADPFINSFTLGSWAIGVGVLSIFLLLWGRKGALPTVRFLEYLFALSPLLAFLPPGGFLLVLSRSLYRRFLSLKIEGDLALDGAGEREPDSRLLLAGSLLLVAAAEGLELVIGFMVWSLVRS
jgi:hypothetical protein